MSHADPDKFLDFGTPDLYEDIPAGIEEDSEGRLFVNPEILSLLAERAFSRIAYFYPKGHLEQIAAVLADSKADERERFVASFLLANAAVSSEGLLPLCQDTGTALIYGWKGENVRTGGADDGEFLARGACAAYRSRALRASQLGPVNMLDESNTGDNLPAGTDLRAVDGSSYRFLFAAKGGGSTSRTSLTMESPAILDPERFEKVLDARIRALGVAGCPPYTIGAVLGGSTPSQTLRALELGVYGLLDALPAASDGRGNPLRDRDWETIAMRLAAGSGLGAQWGGLHLALEARAIRLSRHAANLPLAVGVSCNAHRRARAYIDREGVHLERLEEDPARFLPVDLPLLPDATRINLDKPGATWMAELSKLTAGSTVLLSGCVTVARDKAHARVEKSMRAGNPPPSWFIDHPVFYAGPTEALPGASSGSFGPTTASRMDPYLETLVSRGASLVSIAKGGRSDAAKKALAEAGGIYLACIGGAAALTARRHIIDSRVVDFADLGMEAVREVRLRDLPALVVIDSRGGCIH